MINGVLPRMWGGNFEDKKPVANESETKPVETEIRRPRTQQAPEPRPTVVPDDTNVRLVVRNPNSVEINNVVVEIRQGDKVVATIPSRELMHLIDAMVDSGQQHSKGVYLNDQVD